jgi:transposase
MSPKFVLGIDISKSKFDVSLFDGKSYQKGCFTNDPSGFNQLSRWLIKRDAHHCRAGMEATGRYWEEVAHFLYDESYPVSVLNPKIIKKYGESQLQRNKTDKMDAKLIARYLSKEEPYLWQPPTFVQVSLKSLTRYLNGLLEKRTKECNQLKAGKQPEFVEKSIEETIDFLNKKIDDTEAEIKKLREQNEQLKQQHELLTSIPGIADRSAAIILAELPDIAKLHSAKQLTAYAGLTPQQLQSGNSKKERGLIKLGNKRLRNALFFPAMVGQRFNRFLIELTQRLQSREKPASKKTIIGACMRKLLVLVYGVLKSQKPFDPDYLVHVRNTA